MRIGLMRHFPVKRGLPAGWMTVGQLMDWRREYDASEVTVTPVAMDGARWERCWSSDLPRALVTARAAFAGEVVSMPLLREAEFLPFRTGNLSLPVWMWRWILRLAWMTAHPSQRSAQEDLRKRVLEMAERLEKGEGNTLVVSHAGIMLYLRKELLRRGFRGPGFRLAEHARVYVFER